MDSTRSGRRPRRRVLALAIALATVASLVAGCMVQDQDDAALHRWWSGLGPVLPHDSFPADCRLCHIGQNWNDLAPDFHFDHAKETGVPLEGAHAHAKCLRCHNDRGPVAAFAARGCVGCHEDVHYGELGPNCTRCHDKRSWQPNGQTVLHEHTRLPLTGAHMAVACYRCHPGAWVGNFVPTDTECVTCHRDELAGANNPPHIALGLVDRCDRCHQPTSWHDARTN